MPSFRSGTPTGAASRGTSRCSARLSAAARPQATVFGEDAYPTVHEKAAALLQSLAANHPLLDGNKRTAFVATALFYGLNGHHVPGSAEDELFDLVIAVATGGLDTVSKIAKRLSLIVG